MTPELRAAAERVRIGKYPHDPQGQARSYKDREMLIDAFLAANPADDEEAITYEWLRRIGFKNYGPIAVRLKRDECRDLVADKRDGKWCICSSQKVGSEIFYTELAVFTTRSQLRELLRALGIGGKG